MTVFLGRVPRWARLYKASLIDDGSAARAVLRTSSVDFRGEWLCSEQPPLPNYENCTKA